MVLLSAVLSIGAEEINVVGTGAGMDILKEIASDFMKSNPGVTVNVPASIGSGGGYRAVGKDQERIGRVARGIKESEKAYGLTYVEIAKIPVVFFVHPSVSVRDLTETQIADIYTGKYSNWRELGGDDLPIVIVRRENGDSSLDVLIDKISGFKEANITKKAVTQYNNQENVQYIEKTPGSIGFGTVADAIGYRVSVVLLNGVHPSNASYKYLGVLALIYKNQNFSGGLKAFVDFAASPKARNAIVRTEGIPVK